IVFDSDGDCTNAGTTAAGVPTVVLLNPSTYPCIVITGPVNDSICGALPLTLNTLISGDNTDAAVSDADDANILALGYTCFTLNNTLWYSYTPATSDTVEVVFGSAPFADPTSIAGWFGVVSAPTGAGSCSSGALAYEGCYYGPFNATASGSATADPYDGIIPTADTTINHIFLTAGNTYYFLIDGVAGDFGEFTFGIRSLVTGVNEINAALDSKITLFPNPASDMITINNLSGAKITNVTITNALGQSVYNSQNTISLNEKINVSTFNSGVYSVKIQTEQGITVKNIVLQN
ncbi:MAG: T9SS type A sorting domain-containing protein, partial [Bacteroidota bacterium]